MVNNQTGITFLSLQQPVWAVWQGNTGTSFSTAEISLAEQGLAMILGGGMSNYTDRRNKGYVTDYVSLNVKKKEIRKVVFNLSDVCIAAGTILWAAGNLFSYRKK